MTIDIGALIDISARYRDSYNRFRAIVEHAKSVSHKSGGHKWQDRFEMSASLLFSICMTAESMLTILPNEARGRIDHYSAMALCRVILEHSIMLHYLTENNVSEEEMELRLIVLHTHDANARYRLFKGLGFEDSDKPKEGATYGKKLIRENKLFQSFDADKKARLISGQTLYIHGIRRAARLIGYNEEIFDAVYNYLSSYSHGAPMSFYRASLWGVSAVSPVPEQTGIAALALEFSMRPINLSALQMERIIENNPNRKE